MRVVEVVVVVWAAVCWAPACAAAADAPWKFPSRYPKQYVTVKLAATESPPAIDGRLDDPAWQQAPWTDSGFVDLTHHADPALNVIPGYLQARAKMRWDTDFLYVGAELLEPFVYARYAAGHNTVAPYHDNDFEVFIDVSGTTEYYKEFEMNAANATYDVLWGVPDGAGLQCNPAADRTARPWTPLCTNTSFPGYPGTWSMVAPAVHQQNQTQNQGSGGGMRAAVWHNSSDWAVYRSPSTTWTLEVAFPIRGSASHGGLLDADLNEPAVQAEYAGYDPARGGPVPGVPRYWWFDFARAEHPRLYTPPSGPPALCPDQCSAALAGARADLLNPNATLCAQAHREFPTILGADPYYGCYWEFAWQDLGPDAYMHRPLSWALLEFAPAGSPPAPPPCRHIAFPARHLARLLHYAEAVYFANHSLYSADPHELAGPAYCTAPHCEPADLALALASPARFTLSVEARHNVAALTRACTAPACYSASVTLHGLGPAGALSATATINENRWLRTSYSGAGTEGGSGAGATSICL